MEHDIIEILYRCGECRKVRNIKKFMKLEREDKNSIFKANIELVDMNKYLIEDLKRLCEFVNGMEMPDAIKEIVSRYKEEKWRGI